MQLADMTPRQLTQYADLLRTAAALREDAATDADTAADRDAHRAHAAQSWATARTATALLATR